MIDCMQCGFENPDRHKFCQNCGFSLVSTFASKESTAGVSTTIQLSPAAQVQSESWRDPTTDEMNNSAAISEIDEDAIIEDSEDSHDKDIFVGTIESNSEPDIETGLDDTVNQNESIEIDLDNSVNQNESNDLELEELGVNTLATDAIIPNDLENEINDLRDRLSSGNPNASDLGTQTTNAPQLPIIDKANARVAKPRLLTMRYAGLTDVGKQRNHNEDNFAISNQISTHETPDRGASSVSRGLFVVCDGMGGHAGGEVASSIAIEKIVEQFRPFWIDRLPGSKKLREIILTANQSIFELNENELRRDIGRMGTTLVLLSIYNSEVAIAHVGDSRIYQITASGLKQITRDHEVANRLIDQGVEVIEALSRHDAHQLTQALGPYANHQLEPAIAFSQIVEPTLFLLCSDGLCDNNLVEQNWETYLLPLLAADADLATGVKNLIDLANTINGHDNITAILVNCQVESV
jgi:serine/threonine protein phosphatase PrpC